MCIKNSIKVVNKSNMFKFGLYVGVVEANKVKHGRPFY